MMALTTMAIMMMKIIISCSDNSKVQPNKENNKDQPKQRESISSQASMALPSTPYRR